MNRANSNGGRYRAFFLESINELLKSYGGVNSSAVFFPGCNFAGYFPKLVQSISSTLLKDFGLPTVYDCCSKSVAMLKHKSQAADAAKNLMRSIEKNNIEELIVLCPNCYYHLKKMTNIKVSLLYEKSEIMESLLLDGAADKLNGRLFVPCNDKKNREIYRALNVFAKLDRLSEVKDVACCGAGLVGANEKVFKRIDEKFKNYDERIYVYCASCLGSIQKSHSDVRHILGELMGVYEPAQVGALSYKNRFLLKLKNK